jgi:nitroimidazol reductase NimA-like FMN-containing flavoprotein (pyridoxamine 5'-phosphate oxidase superfamily)
MSDDPAASAHAAAARHDPRRDPTVWDPGVERLDEAECRRLISAGGVGRLAYSGRAGLAVLPVRYQLDEGSIVFRTALDSPTDEDLRTGIEGADYKVTFEIDEVGPDAQEGWFVVIQGAAHHVDSDDDRAAAWAPDAEASARDMPDHFVRITPALVTGRRMRRC